MSYVLEPRFPCVRCRDIRLFFQPGARGQCPYKAQACPRHQRACQDPEEHGPPRNCRPPPAHRDGALPNFRRPSFVHDPRRSQSRQKDGPPTRTQTDGVQEDPGLEVRGLRVRGHFHLPRGGHREGLATTYPF